MVTYSVRMERAEALVAKLYVKAATAAEALATAAAQMTDATATEATQAWTAAAGSAA